MKKKLNKINISVILSTFILLYSCSGKNNEHNMKDMDGKDTEIPFEKKKFYTCPMHPEIIKYKPGNCPICGMVLVEKMSNSHTHSSVEIELNDIIKPVDEFVISSLNLVQPIQKTVEITSNADGYISYNVKDFASISSRFDGRIEKLFINYNFQRINKGDKLFEIYSPELQTVQENLLFLLKNDSLNTSLINLTKKKLGLLGLTNYQIEKLIKTKINIHSTTIYSPVSGYILEESLVSSLSTTPSMNSMSKTNSTQQIASKKTLSIKEGKYLSKGEHIFKVVDYANVWAYIKVLASQKRDIKRGNKIVIQKNKNSQPVFSKIDFIEPIFQTNEKYLSIRVNLKNKKNTFKIGDLISAKITMGNQSSLWINKEAILDLGNCKIVLIKSNNNLLQVKKVKIGLYEGNLVEILEGLTSNDFIAENAQFLFDSESFIKY